LEDLIDVNPQLGLDFDLIFPGDEFCKPADCGTWDYEVENDELAYDVVVVHTEEGIADTGVSVIDSDNGYASVSTQANSAAAVGMVAL
jgi:hypothetical protein